MMVATRFNGPAAALASLMKFQTFSREFRSSKKPKRISCLSIWIR
jgi:hypothetical protein